MPNQRGFTLVELLVVISIIGLRATALITNGLELKGKVLGSADSGITLLGQAGEALHNQNAQLAEKRFIEALGQFKTGKEQLNKTGVLLNTLLLAVPQKRDGEHLISAAESASKAGVLLANTYDNFSKINYLI
jgi:prepilin-type N-terminal cleavage/methylation domain-containing protein